jgi:hypothetical protein
VERPRPSDRAPVRCPYCHDALGDGPAARCQACGAGHHRACWDEHGRCATCAARATAVSDDRVPSRLRVSEVGGVLSIIRHVPDEGQLVAVTFFLALGLACAAASVQGVRLAVGEGERSGGLLMAVLGAVFAWAFLAGALDQAGGRVGLTIDADTVTFRHHAFGVPLARTRSAPRAAVTEVRDAGEAVVIVAGEEAVTWSDLRPEESAWIAARVRRQLQR